MSPPFPIRLALTLGLLPALGCLSTVGSYVRNVYTDGQGRIAGIEKCDLVQSGQTDGVWTENCRMVQPEDASKARRTWGPPQVSTDETLGNGIWPRSSETWSDEQSEPSQPAHPPAPIE